VLAAFEEGLERLSRAVEKAARRELDWVGRVRAGLVALLGFFDDEPGWGRLLVLEAPVGSVAGVRSEQRVLGVLTGLMDDGSPQAIAEVMPEPELTAELVTGGVFSVIRTHMLRGDGGSLAELAPDLTSFVVAPYLGQAAASAERSRLGRFDAGCSGEAPSTHRGGGRSKIVVRHATGGLRAGGKRRARVRGLSLRAGCVEATNGVGRSPGRRARASIDCYREDKE
jgi:hypothetical protein